MRYGSAKIDWSTRECGNRDMHRRERERNDPAQIQGYSAAENTLRMRLDESGNHRQPSPILSALSRSLSHNLSLCPSLSCSSCWFCPDTQQMASLQLHYTPNATHTLLQTFSTTHRQADSWLCAQQIKTAASERSYFPTFPSTTISPYSPSMHFCASTITHVSHTHTRPVLLDTTAQPQNN